MKLTQLLSKKFKDVHLKIQEKKYFKELNQYVEQMFPVGDDFDQNLSQVICDEKLKKLEDVGNNLPYLLALHIRDNQWLAQYVDVCYHYLSTDLTKDKVKVREIPFPVIKNYVAQDAKFEYYRNQYEKKLLKGCIAYCQNTDQESSIADSVVYDDFFRSKIIYTAMKLGIDRTTAEIFLEQNADLWLRPAMYQTFVNLLKFQNPNYISDDKRDLLHDYDPMAWEHFVAKELKYMSVWLRQRQRDYENNHAEVIKKAGLQNKKLDVFESRILDLDVKMAKKEYQDVLSVVNEEIADIEQCGFGLNK